MFCPNCGTKNEDMAVFCASCGAKLEEEAVQTAPTPEAPSQEIPPEKLAFGASQDQQTADGFQTDGFQQTAGGFQTGGFQPGQQSVGGFQPGGFTPGAPAAPKAPLDKKIIIAAVEAVVAIIAIVVFFNVGKNAYGYESTAKNYFECVMNGNWEDAYDMLDIAEGEFLNEDYFVKANSSIGKTEYNAYDVTSSSESKISADVVISYRAKSSSTTTDRYITLNKQSNKNFLFFDSWKISPEAYIASNYTIQVPTGCTVTLDGIELADTYRTSDGTYDVYTIPEIFIGDHQVVVSLEMFETQTMTDAVEYDGDGCYVYDLSLSTEEQDKLIDLAYSDMKTILEAAKDNLEFSAIAELFEEDVRDDAEYYYDYLVDDFHSTSGYDRVTGVSLSNVKAQYETLYTYDGEIHATVYIEYDITIDFLDVSWWDGSETPDTYSTSESDYYYFILVDGEWVLEEGSAVPSLYYY